MTEYQHQRTILQWANYCSNRTKYPVSWIVHRVESRKRQGNGKLKDMDPAVDGAGLSCKGLLWV
ncbi:MAG: hypothetical protein Q4D37_11315 [Oscillospiraceae bacterium]|nr:hypothetical protein [Oscillospiraceae bacterium]